LQGRKMASLAVVLADALKMTSLVSGNQGRNCDKFPIFYCHCEKERVPFFAELQFQ
jgi:hypothetical protein